MPDGPEVQESNHSETKVWPQERRNEAPRSSWTQVFFGERVHDHDDQTDASANFRRHFCRAAAAQPTESDAASKFRGQGLMYLSVLACIIFCAGQNITIAIGWSLRVTRLVTEHRNLLVTSLLN